MGAQFKLTMQCDSCGVSADATDSNRVLVGDDFTDIATHIGWSTVVRRNPAGAYERLHLCPRHTIIIVDDESRP